METVMMTRGRDVRQSKDDWAAQGDSAFDATELVVAGLCVTVRPLRADDLAGYREFVERIDRRDLRLRFGGEADVLHPPALARLVDADDDVAIVATVAAAGSELEIAGDARARIDPHPYGARAEFGLVVRSDLQRMGVGRALLERLIEACRARGVALLYGLVAPSNDGMLALARVLGFDVEQVPGGTAAVVSLDLQSRRARPCGIVRAATRNEPATSPATS